LRVEIATSARTFARSDCIDKEFLVADAERMKRNDLRELLMTTGMALLSSEGVRCGFEGLTFARVFERIEDQTGRRVTAASVYDRIWDSQEDFQWSVLARLIDESSTIDGRTRRRVKRILNDADVTTPEGRWEGLHRLCLFAVEQHVVEASRRQSYRILVAAAGAIASTPADDELAPGAASVRAALQSCLERETNLYVDLYGTIGAQLGFRLREPLVLRQFVLAIGALGDGMALRLTFFPEYGAKIQRPSEQPGGPPSLSSLASLGVEAIATQMLELDPDWTALPR